MSLTKVNTVAISNQLRSKNSKGKQNSKRNENYSYTWQEIGTAY